MYKRIIEWLVPAAVLFCMAAGSATARDFELNIYGSETMAEYMAKRGGAFLSNVAACGPVNSCCHASGNCIFVGQNCDITATDADTIRLRYAHKADHTYDAVNAILNKPVAGGDIRQMCDDNCNLIDVSVNIGASDASGYSWVQATQGWADGNQSFPGPMYTANAITLGFPGKSQMDARLVPNDTMTWFNPLVVPYGFYVNSSTCEYRCTQPGPTTPGATYAYSKYNQSCVPNAGPRTGTGPSDDCIGAFACIDNVCQDGNQGTGSESACAVPDDCPDTAATICREMPIHNLDQTQIRQIFSSSKTLNDWSDLGDAYCAGPIQLCMGHAGLGAHTIFDLAVMQGVPMVANSVPVGTSQRWHFSDDKDIIKCVNDFSGGIGYAEAEKLINIRNISLPGGAHVVMYNGFLPMRSDVENGRYTFWATQWWYYDQADFTDPDDENLRSMLQYYVEDPNNVIYATVGAPAYFWAARNGMNVWRDDDGAPIYR